MPSGVPNLTVSLAAKPWWMSRTLWLNAIVLGLAAAEAQLKVLQPLLPVDLFTLVSFGLPVANAALRFITTQGVSFGGARSVPAPAATKPDGAAP